MKNEELYEILGGIDEKYIKEAKEHNKTLKTGRMIRIVIAAAFAIVLMAFVIVPAIKNSGDAPILPPDITDTPTVTEPNDSESIGDTTTDETTDDRPMGGDGYCSVHSYEYHSFPAFVTERLKESGKDFYAWIVEAEKQSNNIDSDCPFTCATIYEFTKYFDVPKEIWIEYYNLSPLMDNINIDLLYDGTAEENDEYYRLTNIDESILEERDKWMKFKDRKRIALLWSKAEGKSTRWSLVQIAYSAGKTDLSKVLPSRYYEDEFEYNADALSALPEKDIEEIIEKYTPYYLDCLVCGVTPYDTPYERQVALNAEKEQ